MFFPRIGIGLGTKRMGVSQLLTSLVSYWKMDESSDGSAPVTRVDSVTATGNDLTDNNTCASAAGKINNAVHMVAASSESLSHVSNTSLNVGGVDFSFSFWLNLTDLTLNTVMVSKLDAVNAGEYDSFVTNTTGVPHFRIFQAASLKMDLTGTALTAGSYHHIVLTYVSSTKTGSIYIDNGTPNTAISTLDPSDTAIQFTIGANATTGFMKGDMDEVGYWKNRALSTADVALLWNGGAGLSYPF